MKGKLAVIYLHFTHNRVWSNFSDAITKCAFKFRVATLLFCCVQHNNHRKTTFLKEEHLCFKAFSLITMIYSWLSKKQVSHFPAETGQLVLWDIHCLIRFHFSLLKVSHWACKSIKCSMSPTACLLTHLSGWILLPCSSVLVYNDMQKRGSPCCLPFRHF